MAIGRHDHATVRREQHIDRCNSFLCKNEDLSVEPCVNVHCGATNPAMHRCCTDVSQFFALFVLRGFVSRCRWNHLKNLLKTFKKQLGWLVDVDGFYLDLCGTF